MATHKPSVSGLLILGLMALQVPAAAQDSPEEAFLERIDDAVEANDAELLASMLHADVLSSFGRDQCIDAFTQIEAPDMVITGGLTETTEAFWRNAEGRTQMYRGQAFTAGITRMTGGRMLGNPIVLRFAADDDGAFHLFIDCNEKVFRE